MRKYLRVYKECIKINIARALTYRSNFVCTIYYTDLIYFSLGQPLIYGSGAEFPGWSLYEIILIQYIYNVHRYIKHCLWRTIMDYYGPCY